MITVERSNATQGAKAPGQAVVHYENPGAQVLLRIVSEMKLALVHEIGGLGRLSRPLTLRVTKSKRVCIECKELGIIEEGSNHEEALAEFQAFFRGDYENLMQTDERELSDGALDLKRRYLEYVPIHE